MTDDDITTLRRPGGLTALAVLNIILAVIGGLGGLGISAMGADTSEMRRTADEMDRIGDRMAEHPRAGESAELNRTITHGMAHQMRGVSPGGMTVMTILGYSGGLLMFVSAFGLLGRKKFLGRHLALACGLALWGCAIVAVATQGFLFWGFPILGAGYAVVLVAVTQTAYKKVLVN